MGERQRDMHLKCVYTVSMWEIDWRERSMESGSPLNNVSIVWAGDDDGQWA